jgi:DNA mismatch endonuclease (patch repair protein)
MPDIVSSATRSRMMAAIGSRDTVPEVVLRRTLHARGLRYRLHDRTLPGTPDLVFRRFGAVCFVHGCFWHRHDGCPYATTPATREEFWQSKFRENVERDKRNRRNLLESGWRVAVVWECALRKQGEVETSLKLRRWLHGSDSTFETSLSSTAS